MTYPEQIIYHAARSRHGLTNEELREKLGNVDSGTMASVLYDMRTRGLLKATGRRGKYRYLPTQQALAELMKLVR